MFVTDANGNDSMMLKFKKDSRKKKKHLKTDFATSQKVFF